MTTPERGLFERIEPFLESLHPNSAWRNRIKAEIEKFEQRLAEAEARAIECGKYAQQHLTERNKVLDTEEEYVAHIEQLRARCEDLGNIAYKANAANEHWNEFGPEHGFDECMNRLNSALTEIQPQPAQEPKG